MSRLKFKIVRLTKGESEGVEEADTEEAGLVVTTTEPTAAIGWRCASARRGTFKSSEQLFSKVV